MKQLPKFTKTFDELIVTVKEGEEALRPSWHKWVYGGGRNPLLDVKPEKTHKGKSNEQAS